MNKKQWIRNRRNDLLHTSTPAEKAACAILKAMGYNIVVQMPIKTPRRLFFADIAIPNLRVAIEIDGGYHTTTQQKRLDKNRSQCIRRLGWHILRLSNRDARNPKKIAQKIASYNRRISNKVLQ